MKDCKACGAHLPVDMRHRLVTYIQKNKPEPKKYFSLTRDKYKRSNDRAATADNSGDDEVDHTLEADLAALPTAEERADDDDWAADTSASAVAARMKDLAVSGAVDKLLDDDEHDLQDPVETFANYITEASGSLTDEEIISKASELEVRDDKAIAILAQILLDENVLKEDQIKERTPLFQSFLKDEKAQKGLLGGIERLVAISHPALLPVVALILKSVYFNDLVDEEVFLAWSEKISKRYVDKKDAKLIRENAAPFINWLKEAESEDD